jgi:biopolymer transport protein ExbB
MNNIRDYVIHGNLEAAKTLAKSTQNPLARMIEKGVLRIGRPSG